MASLKTRQPKDFDLDLNDLRQQWRERRARIAVDLQHLPKRRQRTDLPSDLQLAAAIVADRATFTVPDLTATAASLCPYGAALDDIEDRVQSFLTSPLAVDLGRSRWTTTEILELEQRSVDTARRRQHQGVATVDDEVLTRALAERPSLSREQRRMVVDVCTPGLRCRHRRRRTRIRKDLRPRRCPYRLARCRIPRHRMRPRRPNRRRPRGRQCHRL